MSPAIIWSQLSDTIGIQLESTPDSDIETLVLDKFIKQGACTEISNIRVIGEIASIGSFTNGSTSIGLSEGISFTTGTLQGIEGPNNSSRTTGSGSGPSDAPYLSRVIRGLPFFDVTGIEFDFVPTGDFASFRYVFASEEYCEFVGSQFNDVFGFFVSGPGINGPGFDNSINVATINDNDDVAINSVNFIDNVDYFVSNFNIGDDCATGLLPKSIEEIEFDGFTTPLQAFFRVIPCQTYHIRLVVGDVSDDILDSAVFLEGQSFDITARPNVSLSIDEPGQDSLIYENCLNGNLVVTRGKLSDRDQPLEVELSYSGPAVNGLDFETLPNRIIIPPGERAFIPISIIPDNIEEGEEYVDVIAQTSTCQCLELDTVRLYIRDVKQDISVFFDEEAVCPGQPFEITPNIIEGTQPLFYEWSTGETSEFITDEISSPQQYVVTVTDACGASNTASIQVQIQAIPDLIIEEQSTFCEGRDPELLVVSFPGQAPWSLEYTIDNDITRSFNNISDNPFELPLSSPGLYQFDGFNDRHCSGMVSGSVEVIEISPEISADILAPSCPNASDGEIALRLDSDRAPYNIRWGHTLQRSRVLSNLSSGSYNVTIIDREGCQVEQSYAVPEAASEVPCDINLEEALYVPNAFTPNSDSINDGFTVFHSSDFIESLSYVVYDRWGNAVYFSSSYMSNEEADFWDGGKRMTGVYTCLIEVILVDGSKEHLQKDVTLLY